LHRPLQVEGRPQAVAQAAHVEGEQNGHDGHHGARDRRDDPPALSRRPSRAPSPGRRRSVWSEAGHEVRDEFHRCDEPIAPARQRFNEAGARGRIAEGRPDLVDCFGEALVEIDEGSLWPEPGLEFAAGDDVTGLFEQRRQDLEWLVFQLDPDAVFPQFPRVQPDLKNTETDLIIVTRNARAKV